MTVSHWLSDQEGTGSYLLSFKISGYLKILEGTQFLDQDPLWPFLKSDSPPIKIDRV